MRVTKLTLVAVLWLACGGKAVVDGQSSAQGGAGAAASNAAASVASSSMSDVATTAAVSTAMVGAGGAATTCPEQGVGGCGTLGNITACWDCCMNAHGSGFMTVVANFQFCGCEAQGCAGPCGASLCDFLNQPPTAACLECARDELCPGPCLGYFDMLCGPLPDQDCFAFRECFGSCPP